MVNNGKIIIFSVGSLEYCKEFLTDRMQAISLTLDEVLVDVHGLP